MTSATDDLMAWLDSLPDPEWLSEGGPLKPQPIYGRGGKPTGEFKPTGQQGVERMEKLFGATMARVKATRRTEPSDEGRDRDLARQQKASAGSMLAPLDELAHQMEKKWGIGRLPTLVPAEWAGKFHSAFTKLNLAIDKGDMVELKERIDILMRGWIKLDELATAGGHQPWEAADVWEVQSPAGRMYAICRRPIDEKNLTRYDGLRVITLEEVAAVLDAWDADGFITELRAQFPGSQIIKPGRIIPEDRPDVGI